MNGAFRLFDLHCDTVSACLRTGQGLRENSLQLDLCRGLETAGPWVQTFAFWIDDTDRGEAAWQSFQRQYGLMKGFLDTLPQLECWRPGQPARAGACRAILAVEGGAVLAGSLDRIARLRECGVRLLTLVWNGDNELGSGVTGSGGGLTCFGRRAVRELEQNGILIDVSHLNDAGFSDLARLARRPFLASHSNARAVCPHPRNLTDAQILSIAQSGGVIGLNFYPMFVNGTQVCAAEELIPHAEHMLSVGGEQVLALGSDFDGASMPEDLPDIGGLENLHRIMIKYFGQNITDRIFYQNAADFFNRFAAS